MRAILAEYDQAKPSILDQLYELKGIAAEALSMSAYMALVGNNSAIIWAHFDRSSWPLISIPVGCFKLKIKNFFILILK